MIVLLVGLALATPSAPLAPAEAPTDAAAPIVRKLGWRPYPWPLYRDWTVERRCVLDVAVDTKGRPAEITPADCPPELVRRATWSVRRDRWQAPVPEGTRTRVEVVYRPPADVMEYPTKDTWRRRTGGECTVHVAVDLAGGVEVVRPPADGCAVTPAPFPAAERPGALVRHVPQPCPVTLLVVNGRATGVDLFRCPVGTYRRVGEGLADWAWPVAEPTPWSVLVELVAPDPGPRRRPR